MACRTRVLVVLALLSTCAALASARPNLLPGDPRLTDPNHQHHHGDHHHGDHGDHAHGDHGDHGHGGHGEHAHDDHHGDHGDHGHGDHGEHAHGDHGDHAHDSNGDHAHGNHGDHGHGDHGNHVEQNPTIVADGSGESANVITDLNDDAVSGEPLSPPELQTELDAAFLDEVGPNEEAVSVTGELAIQFSGEESSSVILDDSETQDEPELSVKEDLTQIQEDVVQGVASGSSASAGIPDISYRQTQAPQATGVPDISYGQNEIDYGAGIQITPAKPGQVGHHNPFNPDYQPPPGLQQVPSSPPTQQVVQQPTSQGAGPGQPANQATSAVKPVNQGAVKPTNQATSAAQPVSQGGIQSPRQGNVQPSNQGNKQPPKYQNYKPTSQIQLGGQLIDVSPQILHPSVFNPTPPPTKRPPTARPTVRPITQAPNKPVSRPSNPFLAGQVNLPSSFQHSPKPVPQPPVTPAPILEVNTHPLGGPAGPKGPIQTVCPAPASALPCVPDAQCDPFTGFLKTDAVKLAYPISKETPTVAVLQCLLPAGGIGICCKKFPRPKPRPTSTALPLGTDYGQGLELVTPRPGNQKPVNVFLPNYKPIPIGTPVSRYVRQ